MKEQIDDLKKNFKLITDEKTSTLDEGRIYYIISGYKSNKNLEFLIRDESELVKIKELFESDSYLYKDYIAIRHGNTIQIVLKTISYRSSRHLDKEEHGKFIEISMHYFKNELDISLRYAKEEDSISKFAQVLRGARRFNRNNLLILEIENYKKKVEDIETDTRNIMNSVLFDIEFTYGIGLETVNTESLKRRYIRRRALPNDLPTEKIALTYKKYIPELIEYYHIGEKVDYLPFKFICYYHIIEYFSDKSAYAIVANYIKKLITKPDFHTKTRLNARILC